MADIAGAAVQLVVDEKGFPQALDKAVKRAAVKSGKTLDTEMTKAGADAGTNAGDAFGQNFSRDVDSRLRDSRGQFVTEGRTMGVGAGDAAGEGFADSLQKALSFRLAGGLLSTLAAPLKALAFAPLAAGAASAAASMTQLVAAVAPAAGIFAALPGAIALQQAALVTLRVAMAGVSDAFSEAVTGDDPAKFAEAIEKLAPAARDTAIALRELRPQFDELRESVQGAAFEGLDQALNDVAGTLLGPLSEGMTAVATEANGLVRSLADVAGSAVGVTFLDSAFATLAELIAAARPGLTLLAEALLGLGTVGTEAIGGFADGIGGVITQLATWIQTAVDSGRALDWINGAITVFQQLGAIIAPIVDIIRSVGAAASQTGGDILGTLGLLIQGVSEFLGTAEGQDFLLSLFEGLNTVGAALLPVLTQLGSSLAPLLPLVGQIAAALGPGLESLIAGLGAGLLPIAEGLVPVATALADVVSAAAPILGVVGQIIGALGGPLSGILTAVADAVLGIFESLQPTIDTILPMIEQFAGILGDTLAPVFTTLGEILAALAPQLGELVLLLVEQMLPVWQQMSTQIGEFLPVLGELIVALVEALLPVIVALLPVWLELQTALAGPILSALTALLPVITFLIQLITPLITLIAEFAAVLIDVLVGAIEIVLGWIQTLIDWIADLWEAGEEGRQGFIDAWKAVGEQVAETAESIKDWIDDVVQWFLDLPGRILNAISGLGSAIWDSITSGIGDLGSIIPGFADGTPDTGSTGGLAILHPHEAVIPMTRPARALQIANQSGLTDMILDAFAAENGGAAGQTVNVGPVVSNSPDPVTVANMVAARTAAALRGAK